MKKNLLLSLSGVALLGSLLTFGAFNSKASNTQDFEHSDFKIVEVVKNEKYQQLSYFFSGSFPIDLTKLDMNNQEDADFINNIPAIQQTNDITTIYSEELDETKGSLFSEFQNQQLGYYEQSLDGTGKYYAVFYDRSNEYDLYLIKDSETSLVENNNIDPSLLDYYFYEIDGKYYPYLDIMGLQDDEQYALGFEKYTEDVEIDVNNSWNFVPAYSGNVYSQNEDKTYSLKDSVKTSDFNTYNSLSEKPIIKMIKQSTVEGTESVSENSTESVSENSTESVSESDSKKETPQKIRGSISAYEYINVGSINFAFNSIFSQKYTNPTVRVITYDDLTTADIEDADLIYFNTNSEDTFYSKEYEKYNESTDTLSNIDVFTSDIDKKIIDNMYDNKLIVLWGSEFKTNALQHEQLSKTDLVYTLTSNTYASIIKNGKLNDSKTLYDYLDSYDGTLKELYSSVPTFTSAEDIASSETLQRFNIVNTDLAYNICSHGILDLPSDDLVSNWGSLLIENNELNKKAVENASSISLEAGVLYLLNEDRASGLGSNARLLEIEPCADYTDTNYWNWRMFGIAPYFTGDITVEQMNIDEFICKNTDLLSDYDVIFIGSNYNITKQGGMPYSQWVVDDTVKRYSTAVNYVKIGELNVTTEVPLSELYKGEDITIKSIVVKASDHTHKSWQGSCNSSTLNELTIDFADNKFTVNAQVAGNYNINIETNEGINFGFNYIIPNDSYIGSPYYGNISGKKYWLSNQKLNNFGDLEYAYNPKYFTSSNVYSTYTRPYEHQTYYKLELNSYKVTGVTNYVDTQPIKWYAQYYDEAMNVLSTVESDNGIFAINTDAFYVRFMFDYSNISDRSFADFSCSMSYYYTSDTEIVSSTYWHSNNQASSSTTTKNIYLTKGDSYTFYTYGYDLPFYTVGHKPSSDFDVDTHNNSSTITITYSGNNTSVQDYLELYCGRTVVRLNLNAIDMESRWSSKGGFPTKFRDSTMNGKIYYHVGDITDTLNSGDKFYAGAVDDNADINGIYTATSLNKSTRLSGNDLTKKMYDKLVEYVDSGRALILSDQLYNEDGTINTAGVDTSSYIYKLMNEYSDKVLNDKNSINFDFSYLTEDCFNLEFEEMPLVYRDYTLFDFDDTTKTATFDSKKFENSNHAGSSLSVYDYTYNCEDGGKTEYSYDELGINSSSEANVAFYQNKNNKSLKQVELKFKIDTNSSYTDTYSAKFYSDEVSDGIFDESERLDFYSIRDEDGNSYNSGNLVAGKTYTVKINLDDDFSGCLHWKLLVTRGDSDSIRGSFESYCAFLPTERTRLDILQITPYNSYKSWSKDNSALTSYDSFMQLVKDNKDYDINIKVISAEEFNNLDFSSYLVYDEANNIKKTFAQMDMLIIGFGDFGDYAWTDEALSNLVGFVSTGKAVLFTHDSSSFVNTLNSVDKISGVDLTKTPQVTKNYYMNRYLRNLLGQDKYGVTLRDTLNSNESKINITNAKLSDVKTLGAQSESFLNIARKYGKDLAYTLDSNQSSTYYDIDGMTPFINGTTIQNPNIQSASMINRGQISSYPYYIPDQVAINRTHPQYYQLDLEDPNLTVWYTLDSDDASSKDGQNFYYIYNRKNVTYSGVGHEELRGDMSLFEWKLYFNTMIMAYRQARSMSLVCTSDDLEQYDNTVQMYIDYATEYYNYFTGLLSRDEDSSNPDRYSPLRASFRVDGVNALAGTTDKLYIHLEGVSMCDNPNFVTNDFYANGTLVKNEDYLFNSNTTDYTFSVANLHVFSDSIQDYVGEVGKVELIRISESGIKQVLDTKIINITRRSAYNIR